MRAVGAELFHADGRTDMTKLVVNFAILRTRLNSITTCNKHEETVKKNTRTTRIKHGTNTRDGRDDKTRMINSSLLFKALFFNRCYMRRN